MKAALARWQGSMDKEWEPEANLQSSQAAEPQGGFVGSAVGLFGGVLRTLGEEHRRNGWGGDTC